MSKEEQTYIWTAFETHVAFGKSPAAAWEAALEDWFYVYKTEDDRIPLARAAELALKQLKDCQDDATRVSGQT